MSPTAIDVLPTPLDVPAMTITFMMIATGLGSIQTTKFSEFAWHAVSPAESKAFYDAYL